MCIFEGKEYKNSEKGNNKESKTSVKSVNKPKRNKIFQKLEKLKTQGKKLKNSALVLT